MTWKAFHYATLVLFLVCTQGASGAEEALVLDKTSGCRLLPFRDWAGHDVQWVGPCDEAIATGLGVLKHYENGKLLETFYGELAKGEPVIGVIDKGAGYEAGRVEGGVMQDTSDGGLTVRAFNIATKAARAVSERFRKAGNKKSAAYYHSIEKQLAEALD
jgi:hypothetical protein